MIEFRQRASYRTGWVERMLLPRDVSSNGLPLSAVELDSFLLFAQIEQGSSSPDGIFSWRPARTNSYPAILDDFLRQVVPKYGYLSGARLTVEYLLDDSPRIDKSFTLPTTGMAIAAALISKKVTQRDVISHVLVCVEEDLTIEFELNEREQPTLCGIVLKKIVHPAIAPFLTRHNSDPNVRGNGEVLASALSADASKFPDSMAFAAPLPVEY